jgi:hypothetical protein
MAMTDKNILAYFNTPEDAEGVSRKLKALRVNDVAIDRFSKYPGDGVERNFNPTTGHFFSLGNLTLDADYDNKSAGILSATDVTASGMSDGGQGGPNGLDILLTAIVQEDMYDKALQVIKEGGGHV